VAAAATSGQLNAIHAKPFSPSAGASRFPQRSPAVLFPVVEYRLSWALGGGLAGGMKFSGPRPGRHICRI